MALFFWGTERLVTGPISHKQQFFFFSFLAFWSKQCEPIFVSSFGFSPVIQPPLFFLDAAYVLLQQNTRAAMKTYSIRPKCTV